MQKPSLQPQFIERIVTSPTGEQYRVVFEVTVVRGQVRARAVRAERLEVGALRLDSPVAIQSNNSSVFCLPCASASLKVQSSKLPAPAFFISPFTSLLFFTSQPTRAPSVA